MEVSELTDEYVLNLSITDNMSAPADAIAAKLDDMTKSAEGAGAAAAGAGARITTAADQITAAGAAWDRMARRNDDVSAAVYRLKAAQEELTRVQAQAQRALEAGSADQATVNRVLDEQVQKVERAAAALIDVREAAEGAAEAQRLWQGNIADGSEALSGLQSQLTAFAAASQAAFAKQLNITAPTSDADYAKRADDIAAYGAALDALRAKVDPVFAASKAYEAQVNALNDALTKGAVPLEVYDQLLDGLNTSFAKGTQSLGAFTAKTAEYAQAAQAAFNKQLNVTAPTSDADYAKRADDIAAYGQALDALRAKFDPVFATSKEFEAQFDALNEAIATGALPLANYDAALDDLNASFAKVAIGTDSLAARQQAQVAASAKQQAAMDALRAKIDPVFALSKAYEAQVNALNEAIASGALPASQEAVALDRLNTAFDRSQKAAQAVVVSHGQAAFAVRQLGVQTVQFFSSIEAGQSVFTAFVQQGHQILDVALATGTGFGVIRDAAKQAWAAITTPTGLIITGIVGVTTAILGLGYAAETTARSQAKLRDELSASRADYANAATAVTQAGRNIAGLTPASTADATAAAQILASNSQIDASTQSLTKLGVTAQLVSQVIGKSIQDTATLISDAQSDPAKVAVGLTAANKLLLDLDSVTVANIAHMQQMGDTAGATAKLMDAFGQAALRARDNETPLQRAIEDLNKALMGSGDPKGKTFFQEVGTAITDLAATTVSAIAKIIGAMNDFYAYLQQHPIPETADPAKAQQDIVDQTNKSVAAIKNFFGLGGTGSDLFDSQIKRLQQQFPSLFQPAPGGTSVLVDPTRSGDLQGHGIFQVTPPTAATQGLSTSFIDANAAQNIISGMYQLEKLFEQFKDLPDAAAKITQSYGGFSLSTPQSVAAFNAKTAKLNAADVGHLPTDVAGAIGMIGQLYGWPDWMIALAQKTAVVESGGLQFQATVSARSQQQAPLVTGTSTDIANANAGARLLATNANDQEAAQLAKLTEQYKQYTAARSQALIHDDLPQVEQYDKLIAQTAADMNALIHPTEAATKALQDQGAVAAILSEADQKRAASELALARQREQNPLHPESDADAAKELNAQLGLLSAQYALQVKQTELATRQQQELTVAWAGGAKGAADAAVSQQAYNLAVQKFGETSPAAAAAQAAYTQTLKDHAKALDETKAVQESLGIAQQIEVTKAETSALLENGDARALMVQHMKDQFDIASRLPNLSDQEKAALLAQKDALAAVTQELQKQQQTASYLAQQFGQAFDAIGTAITQAFVQGEGSAVKWGNVLQGVVTQVIQMFAHLAILNPLTNALFGQNQPTLGSVFNLLGNAGSNTTGSGVGTALRLVDLPGGGTGLAAMGSAAGIAASGLTGTVATGAGAGVGGALGDTWDLSTGGAALAAGGAAVAGGGGGAMGLLSNAGSLFSVAKALFPSVGNSSGSFFSGITDSLGLTGPGGVLSGLTSFLNTPIVASSVAPETLATLASAPGAFSPAALTAATAPTATIGSLIGGVGAGFGAGSLVGGFVQNALGKTGPAPTVGAGLGSAAGAAIGTFVVPVLGTLAGALIGGVLGGAGGGLIGPKPASPYSSTVVGVTPEGLLSVGHTQSQKVDASQERAGAISDVAALNQLLTSRNVRVSPYESQFQWATPDAGQLVAYQIGQNTPGGFQDPDKFANIASLFPNLRFTSATDPTIAGALSGRSFASADELAGVTQSLTDFENALKGTIAEADTTRITLAALSGVANSDVQPALQKISTFITATLPTLTQGNIGSLATAQNQVTAQFSDALATANQIGVGVNELTAAQQKAYDKNNQIAQAQVAALSASVQQRAYAVGATLTGSPQDALNAQLVAFDNSAAQQRQQLSDTLTGIFGDAYATTTEYAQKMADNDATTAQERLAIQQQFNQQQVQLQQASNVQLLTLQSRVVTSAAALTGNPQQMQAAQVQALTVTQASERISFDQSLQQSYGAAYQSSPDYLTKLTALLTAQANEMALLQQQIARQNLQNTVASGQQDEGFNVRFWNAQAQLYPGGAAQAQRAAFETQASQEQQNLYLSLTATYGNAYALTQEYADKLNALVKAQGEERLALEQTLHDQQRQQDIANAQQDASLVTRLTNARAQLSGDPASAAAAQTAALRVQQVGERQSFIASLLATYGEAYAYTKNYTDKLAALDQAQSAEAAVLQAQIARANLERSVSSQQQDQSFATRYTNAAAQVSGSVADQNAAALAAFDAQAQQEIQNLYLSLTATYGAAYATSKEYADKLTALQKAQGEERLALQKQQDDALKSQATSSIASLNQYAISLQTSDKSPLSPQAQLSLAQRQFDTQAALAASGNFSAVQTLQQYSDAYLSAAHTVYGSGINYVQAFGKVITALAQVGAQDPDALTASVLQTETRTQTAILVEQLQELQDEVKQLRLQLMQGQSAPARVTA